MTLKIEKTLLEDHQIELSVEVDSEPWDKSKHQAARRLSKRVKIAGFRPGKAPYAAIIRQVGEGAIIEEALDLVIEEIYPKLIEDAEIKPYGPGTVKDIPTLDPLMIEFIVPLQPIIELGNYKTIELPYEIPDIGDDDIDKALEEFRERNAVHESVDRAAEEGDTVYLRVSAKRLDIEDQQEAVIFDQQFSSARIGEEESAADRQFFPGFSQNLIGMTAQEEKSFPYSYPNDFEDEELQGIEAEFQVSVTNIQTQEIPDLDDELAKTVSDFNTLEELRADIESNLIDKANTEYESTYSNRVIEEIVTSSSIKYPPQAIENEKKDILSNMEFQLSRQGLSKELYLQFRSISEEDLDNEISDTAKDNVQRSIVLYEIARVEDIQADEDVFSDNTNRAIQSVTEGMTPKQIKDLQKDGRMASLITNIAADLTLQKTIEFLVTTAKGESWPKTEDQTEEETESTPEKLSDPEETVPVEVPAEETKETNTQSEDA